MRAFLVLFSLTLLLLQVKVAPAQEQKLVFQSVPLPSGCGIAATQDRRGFMWFAHVGVYKYDGYKYKSYFNDPLDSNSLAGDWVEALCADHNGFIWIGTRLFGLDRLDPETGHFTHFRHDPKNGSTISSDVIRTILEDREGIVWVGTDSGLNKYDPRTGMFQHYNYDPKNPYSLSCDHVFKIYEDRQGTLWVGTGSIWYGEGGETGEGGLNRFDKNTGKFTRYLHDPKNPHSLIDNKVRSILEDSRGTFWVGTAGDGLHTMNRINGTFERHTYDPVHRDKLSRSRQINDSASKDAITFITEDITGAIWIGTFRNGVNRYNYKTNKVEYYPNFEDPASGIQTKSASWAYNSGDGMLWIGYWEGIFLINPLQSIKSHFYTGAVVNDILEDSDNMIWYSTRNGLVRKDQNTGTERRFVCDPNNPRSISSNIINGIYGDRQGILWIGTANGLNRFDREKDGFTRYGVRLNSSTGDNNEVRTIYEDRHGSFWLGTGSGLVLMDRKNGSFENYFYNPGDIKSWGNNLVLSICEDKHGDLWVGGFNGGINKFIPQTKKFQRFLNGVSVFSLCADSKGVLWAGTSAGLYRSNLSLNSFSHFKDSNLCLRENTMICGLLEDNEKCLWINTLEGIYRLNQSRNEVVRYSNSKREGKWGYEALGCHMGKRKDLLFGGDGGYYIFLPEQLTKNSKPPKIEITQFRVGDKEVISGEGPLKEPLSQVKEIRLRYDQNVFSFDFVSIHYKSPEYKQLLFRLDGLEKTWRKAGEEKTAYYYDIPPGQYVFRVKAANSDGVWAEKALIVIIDPPWWRTWWAYILYTLSLAAVIYAFIQYRISRIRAQHEIILQKHKAVELEMQALRAQMNPHFIFNCLNSINRFIIKNETEVASDYLTKFSRLIRMVLTNSKKTFINLEEELDMLRLYIELERLRFKNAFDYNIGFQNEIEPENIFIPPLLLQPFAENAIWHGLMHKEAHGHLEIALSVEQKVLTCMITDDGIGRDKAAEFENNSTKKPKSLGLQITRERLALLNQNTEEQSFFNIEDITDDKGKVEGTRVILKMNYRNLEDAIA